MLRRIMSCLTGHSKVDVEAVLRTIGETASDACGFSAAMEKHPGLTLDEAWEIWSAREIAKTERWLAEPQDAGVS